MTSIRRATVLLAPLAAVLALAACGGDEETAASSTPSTPATASTTTAAPTTALPASTAVGQPIPIGQDTVTVTPTAAPPDGSADPGSTTVATGDTGPAGAPTTSGSGAGATTASASTTTTSTGPDDEPPGPNASTAFCTFEAEVENAGDTAVDDAAFLAALAGLHQRMDQWITDAPTNDLRAAATTMRDASKQALDAQSVDPLDADDATEALLNIRLYCADLG